LEGIGQSRDQERGAELIGCGGVVLLIILLTQIRIEHRQHAHEALCREPVALAGDLRAGTELIGKGHEGVEALVYGRGRVIPGREVANSTRQVYV
jgi:hypothetical protein